MGLSQKSHFNTLVQAIQRRELKGLMNRKINNQEIASQSIDITFENDKYLSFLKREIMIMIGTQSFLNFKI